MAQGTPNVAECIPTGLRLLEHQPVNGGGSGREQACALPSGPQARMNRLWDFEDPDQSPGFQAVNAIAPAAPTGADEPLGSSLRAGDLTESDLDNLRRGPRPRDRPEYVEELPGPVEELRHVGSRKGRQGAARRPGAGRRLPRRAHRGARPQTRNAASRGGSHSVRPQGHGTAPTHAPARR